MFKQSAKIATVNSLWIGLFANICFVQGFPTWGTCSPRAAMPNPNGLLSQKVCHCLDQGRTLNDILLRATHGMAYLNLNKLTLV